MFGIWTRVTRKLGLMRGRPSHPEGFHAYWLAPDGRNLPSGYLAGGHERSRHLVKTVGQHFDKSASIFEIGCNAGRNLQHLFRAGFRNLQALEINPAAVELLRQANPELAQVPVHVGSVEEKIKSFPTDGLDLTFTMAVLEHVHEKSDWVFAEIARISRNLLTIEDERSYTTRHFPRNYRKVFEALGMRQVYEERGLPDLSDVFVLRLFRKA